MDLAIKLPRNLVRLRRRPRISPVVLLCPLWGVRPPLLSGSTHGLPSIDGHAALPCVEATWLMLSRLLAVAGRTQWAEPVVGVGVAHALGYEVTSTDRVVVGDGGLRWAEAAQRVAFQVAFAPSLPA